MKQLRLYIHIKLAFILLLIFNSNIKAQVTNTYLERLDSAELSNFEEQIILFDSNGIRRFYHKDTMINRFGLGSVSQATVIDYRDTVTFDSSFYVNAYTATDTIQQVFDTTGQVYGNFTIEQIDFGTGQVYIVPDGADPTQIYGLNSGDTLVGVHTIYYEATPYGVVVSVPTVAPNIDDADADPTNEIQDLQSVTANGAITTDDVTVGGLDITTVPEDTDNSATGILVHDDITKQVEHKAIGANEIVFGTANGGVESDSDIRVNNLIISTPIKDKGGILEAQLEPLDSIQSSTIVSSANNPNNPPNMSQSLGVVQTFWRSSSTAAQLFIGTHADRNMFIRNKNGGIWKNWEKLYSSFNYTLTDSTLILNNGLRFAESSPGVAEIYDSDSPLTEVHLQNSGFDVSTTPTDGDIYKYDAGSGLFELVQPESDSIHGWAQYTDTIYTTSNRLSIAAGDTVTLANNAGETITSHLPLGVTSLYNATDTLITPDRSGDSYNIRVDFTASSSSNDGYFSLVLDIGGSQGIILSNLKTFPKGSGTEHDFSITNAIYTLDTFIANGGKLKIIGGVGTTEIWDINFLIIRTSRARN